MVPAPSPRASLASQIRSWRSGAREGLPEAEVEERLPKEKFPKIGASPYPFILPPSPRSLSFSKVLLYTLPSHVPSS